MAVGLQYWHENSFQKQDLKQKKSGTPSDLFEGGDVSSVETDAGHSAFRTKRSDDFVDFSTEVDNVNYWDYYVHYCEHHIFRHLIRIIIFTDNEEADFSFSRRF